MIELKEVTREEGAVSLIYKTKLYHQDQNRCFDTVTDSKDCKNYLIHPREQTQSRVT